MDDKGAFGEQGRIPLHFASCRGSDAVHGDDPLCTWRRTGYDVRSHSMRRRNVARLEDFLDWFRKELIRQAAAHQQALLIGEVVFGLEAEQGRVGSSRKTRLGSQGRWPRPRGSMLGKTRSRSLSRLSRLTAGCRESRGRGDSAGVERPCRRGGSGSETSGRESPRCGPSWSQPSSSDPGRQVIQITNKSVRCLIGTGPAGRHLWE
jgi:hypothetical protein